jgi:putative addiction module CopG family antidote
MTTINISLPSQLKDQADSLIDKGYYASFSDLVRTALRDLVSGSRYDALVREAIEDHRKGKTKALRTKKEIDEFVDRIMS